MIDYKLDQIEYDGNGGVLGKWSDVIALKPRGIAWFALKERDEYLHGPIKNIYFEHNEEGSVEGDGEGWIHISLWWSASQPKQALIPESDWKADTRREFKFPSRRTVRIVQVDNDLQIRERDGLTLYLEPNQIVDSLKIRGLILSSPFLVRVSRVIRYFLTPPHHCK